MMRRIMHSLAVVATLTIAGCSSGSATSATQAPETQEILSTPVTAASDIVDAIGMFTAQLVGGAEFDSAQVLKTEPIAFWFWAPG